jgi:serine protease Do
MALLARRPLIRLLRTCLVSCAVLLAGNASGVIAGQEPQRSTVAPDVRRVEADRVVDFRDVQERARRAAEKVRQSVVAVEKGSGIIISAQGLILSQSHVSHGETRRPGDRVKVVLHDGRECPAELLGANPTHDISLLKLVAPGPYVFTPLDGESKVEAGDWVLMFGHPFTYQPGRAALARLGRVIDRTDEGFCTDCLMASGDSGGPFFSLDGKLVGILRTGTAELNRLAGDALTIRRHIGQIMSSTSVSVVARHLDEMKRGEVPALARDESDRIPRELSKAPARLPVGNWLLGPDTLASFPAIDPRLGACVVQILNGGAQIALGTVVGADGEILTKASELPPEPQCRLHNGRVVAATVVALDAAFDLALLRVDAAGEGLREIAWPADRISPTVGTILAAVGFGGGPPTGVGIVSAPRRNVPNAARPDYALPLRQPATIPGLKGKSSLDGKYRVSEPWDAALAAGIQPGDVVLSLDGRAITKVDDIVACTRGRLSGDVVTAKIVRGEKEMEIKIPLCASNSRFPNHNYRYKDFPEVLEHAVPLFPHECGGPLVDLHGRFIGINIARAGPHGCAAIPADRVGQLLADLRAGRGADKWLPSTSAPR